MGAPDFSKYDEAQLRQILTRIDRERFPERVTEIEARLETLTLRCKGSVAPISVEPSTFAVKPLPDGAGKVFGAALPFFVIATISFGVALLQDASTNPSILAVASLTGMVAVFGGLAMVYFRLSTLMCPMCRHECEKHLLDNRNWAATCKHCQIHWDTGIGSDD
jgi:hypothetical protein